MDYRGDSFINLCRLCATYDAVKLEIFGEEGQERSLVEKIQTCLPFQVSKNDPLPKSLCYRCMYNLENFYDFRMGCVNAVALLESCLRPDGGKNLDKASAEKRARIMKQMRRHASRDSDTSMPQLEPQVPLPPVVKIESDDEVSNDTKSQKSDNAMPKLPAAVDYSGGNTDDDLEEVEDDEEEEGEEEDIEYDDEGEEKVIDIDPADYLESNVAVEIEDSNQGGSSKKSTESSENRKGTGSFELYTCKICGKALSSKGHLSLHLRIHKDDANDNSSSTSSSSGQANPPAQGAVFCRPYRCDLCNKSYSSSKHLWGHVSSNHRGDPAVTCPECHRLFSSVSNLEEHKRSKHGDTGSDEVESEKSVNKPIHNDGLITSKRRVSTTSLPQKSENEENINGKRPAACEEAGGNRRKSSRPRKIARTHSSESHEDVGGADCENVCALCCEKFPDIMSLMVHTKEHEEEHEKAAEMQPLSCLLCEKKFAVRTSLHNHLKSEHGIDPADLVENQQEESSFNSSEEPVVKVEVDVSVKTETDDQEHHMLAESMLESETVFCCEACIREFTDRSSLWLHMLYTHKEAAATACGLCLKVCGDLSSLSLHLQSCHTASQMLVDKRRYSCTVCMRQHDSRKKLLSHVLIHDIGSAQPEDLIILNSDLYQVELDREQDLGSAEQENLDNSTSSSVGNQNIPSSTNAAVAAAAAVAANSPFACQICLKIFPNEEKMVKHKQNAHRQDALVHATTGTGTYHLFFRCEICGVSHQSKSERWKHVYEEHKGDATVTCSRSSCGKVFASAELNQEHVNHHKVQGTTPNTCEICGKLWNSRVDYWKHMMGVHAEVVPYTCGVCLKVLPDLPQLMDHVKSRHWPLSGGDYCCDICGRPYSNRSKMSRHRKIHYSVPGEDVAEVVLEEEPPPSKIASEKRAAPPVEKNESKAVVKKLKTDHILCEACPDKKFPTRDDLIQHRRTDHGMLTCDLCDKFYGRTSHLWKHVNRQHRGHPTVTCSECGKVSASKAHLRSHILKMHRSGNSVNSSVATSATFSSSSSSSNPSKVDKPGRALGPQSCPQCSKIFCNRYRMLRHLKSCGQVRSAWKQEVAGPFPCQICSKVFDKLPSLKSHIKSSHVTYSCELCGEGSLESKTVLMEHIMIAHRGTEQLTCSVEGCGLTLRCSADREKHESQHRYGIPPTCQVCGELFSNRLRLRKHLVTHQVDLRTVCNLCFTAFPNCDEMHAHVLSEHETAAGRPNTCRVCAKSCGSRSNVIKHVNQAHEGETRLCTVCLDYFSNHHELKKHIEEEHSKDDKDVDENEISSNDDEEDDDEDDDEEEEDDEEEDDEEEEEEDDQGSKTNSNAQDSTELQRKAHLRSSNVNGLTAIERKDKKDTSSDLKGSGKDIQTNTKSTTSTNNVSDFAEKVVNKHVTSIETRPRRLYKCNICKESFRMPSLLMQHQKQRHRSGSKPMQCNSCNKAFSNKMVFSKHVELCTKDKSSILQKTLETGKKEDPKDEIDDFASIAGFNGHFLDGSCKDENSFGAQKSIKHNRKVYGGNEGPVHCQLCNKVWPALKQQWQHLIRTHREAAATTCGVCLEICSDYESLSAHLSDVHPDCWEGEGKNFTCRICGRYHNARSKLELHNSIHLGLESDEPTNVSESGNELNLHMVTHSHQALTSSLSTQEDSSKSDEPDANMALYVCPSCSMVFPVEQDLKVHMTTKCENLSSVEGSEEDTTDNSYSCQRCNSASFSSYINLTKHYKHCPDKSNQTLMTVGHNSNDNDLKQEDSTDDQEACEEEPDVSNGHMNAKSNVVERVSSLVTYKRLKAGSNDLKLNKKGVNEPQNNHLVSKKNEEKKNISRQAVEDLVKDIKDLGSALQDTRPNEKRSSF